MAEWIGSVIRYKQTHPHCMETTGYTISREDLQRWAKQRHCKSMETAVDALALKNGIHVEWHKNCAIFKEASIPS